MDSDTMARDLLFNIVLHVSHLFAANAICVSLLGHCSKFVTLARPDNTPLVKSLVSRQRKNAATKWHAFWCNNFEVP